MIHLGAFPSSTQVWNCHIIFHTCLGLLAGISLHLFNSDILKNIWVWIFCAHRGILLWIASERDAPSRMRMSISAGRVLKDGCAGSKSACTLSFRSRCQSLPEEFAPVCTPASKWWCLFPHVLPSTVLYQTVGFLLIWQRKKNHVTEILIGSSLQVRFVHSFVCLSIG